MERDLGVEEYQIKAWLYALGSRPEKRVRYADYGQTYEVEMMHVFILQNGKYATVLESGCSCYDSSDAEIEVFATFQAAVQKFNQWEREQKEKGHRGY